MVLVISNLLYSLALVGVGPAICLLQPLLVPSHALWPSFTITPVWKESWFWICVIIHETHMNNQLNCLDLRTSTLLSNVTFIYLREVVWASFGKIVSLLKTSISLSLPHSLFVSVSLSLVLSPLSLCLFLSCTIWATLFFQTENYSCVTTIFHFFDKLKEVMKKAGYLLCSGQNQFAKSLLTFAVFCSKCCSR